MLAAVEKIVKTSCPEIQYILKGLKTYTQNAVKSPSAARLQLKMTCVFIVIVKTLCALLFVHLAIYLFES